MSKRFFVGLYAHRWVIEEYHKCLKSGCAVQARQLTTSVGLQRVLGFLAIVAVKLLQLRMLSRTEPECLALPRHPTSVTSGASRPIGVIFS